MSTQNAIVSATFNLRISTIEGFYKGTMHLVHVISKKLIGIII